MYFRDQCSNYFECALRRKQVISSWVPHLLTEEHKTGLTLDGIAKLCGKKDLLVIMFINLQVPTVVLTLL